jgi:hypothetical protein
VHFYFRAIEAKGAYIAAAVRRGNFLLSRRRFPPHDRFRNYDDWGWTDVVDVNINVQGCARGVVYPSIVARAAMFEMPAVESLADVASAVETGVPAVARKAASLDAGVTTTARTLRKGLRRTI